ncbi:MAG: hypothetical protein ACI4RI_07700, partial [Ruminococcus sp.]
MSNNNREFNESELRLKEERQKKVASFHMHIDDSVLDGPYEPKKEQSRRKKPPKRQEESLSESQELNSFSGGKTRAEVEKDMKKADKRQQKEAKKREKRKSKKNKRIFTTIWLIMVIMAGVILSRFILTGLNDMLAISRPEANEVTIKITKEDNLDDIADILYKKGIIEAPGFFNFYASM